MAHEISKTGWYKCCWSRYVQLETYPLLISHLPPLIWKGLVTRSPTQKLETMFQLPSSTKTKILKLPGGLPTLRVVNKLEKELWKHYRIYEPKITECPFLWLQSTRDLQLQAFIAVRTFIFSLQKSWSRNYKKGPSLNHEREKKKFRRFFPTTFTWVLHARTTHHGGH